MLDILLSITYPLCMMLAGAALMVGLLNKLAPEAMDAVATCVFRKARDKKAKPRTVAFVIKPDREGRTDSLRQRCLAKDYNGMVVRALAVLETCVDTVDTGGRVVLEHANGHKEQLQVLWQDKDDGEETK